MKIRNGFVSNSSSSSFIVTMKNGEKMTKDLLMNIFDVKKTSPLYVFANELSDWMMKSVNEKSIRDIHENYVGSSREILSDDEIIEDIVNEQVGMDREELEKIKNKEIRYYECSVSNCTGEALEDYLYEGGIEYEDSNIKIQSGY